MTTHISIADLTAELQSAINDLKTKPEISETGVVTKVSDGIGSMV